MISSDLYPFIFKRKSVRRFEQKRLEESVLSDLNNKIVNLEPLFEDIETEVTILNKNEVGGFFTKKAPYYIALYSEEKAGYLINAGFILQQIDLFLSSKDLASLWLGMGKPQEQLAKQNGLQYVISLAFGTSKEKVHRESVSEFKRKPISEISSVTEAEYIIEAVRLAPSSINNQPWYLEGGEDSIKIYSKKISFAKNTFLPITRKLIPIDMGIALCHLKIAANYSGKTIKFVDEGISSKKAYNYVVTANLNDK